MFLLKDNMCVCSLILLRYYKYHQSVIENYSAFITSICYEHNELSFTIKDLPGCNYFLPVSMNVYHKKANILNFL